MKCLTLSLAFGSRREEEVVAFFPGLWQSVPETLNAQ